MMKSETRNNSVRKWIERSLLLAGVLGLGLWCAANVVPAVWQQWGNWVFERELRGETATVEAYAVGEVGEITRDVERWFGVTQGAKPSVPREGGPQGQRPILGNRTLVGRLTIPRLHLSAIVREGVGQDTLGLAVGHIPETALPGEDGNVGVAGHRDTLFMGLKGIEPNDLVHFETLDGSYVYQVKSTEIVSPRDVGVLKAGQYPELTLVTCYPFNYIGPAPDRLIIKAREVSRTPREDKPAEGGQADFQQHLSPHHEARGEDAETPRLPEEAPVAARTNLVRKSEPIKSEETEQAGTKKVIFDIYKSRGRTLVPGISVGIDDTDVTTQRVTGWVVIMPDRRTIQLRDQGIGAPVVFYNSQDGTRNELQITNVTGSPATGYLLVSRN
jgi:sortase A